MTANLNVYVFRTNLQCNSDKEIVGRCLSGLAGISDWSVDMEDIDRVLRVVTSSHSSHEIIASVNSGGFSCIELL